MPHQKKPARLNATTGHGYAVIKRHDEQVHDCRGLILVDDATGLHQDFLADREFIFTGTVYDGNREKRASFPVLVSSTLTTTAAPRVTVRFEATGERFPQV